MPAPSSFDDSAFVEPHSPALLRYAGYALLAAGLLVAAWYLYRALTDINAVKVDAPPQIAIDMMPPPPPPPPPPPEPKIKPPEPVETPTPSPTPEKPAESPKAEAAPTQMDATAEAGSDAFGVSAGKGTGMGSTGSKGNCVINCGGGVGDGYYAGYLSRALEERIRDNRKVNRQLFSAEFAISVGPGGQITGAELVKSTGDAKRDAAIREVLVNIKGLDAPPSTLRFPQKITVRGDRARG